MLDYAKMELAAGEIARTKTLLGKSVRNSLDPELWQFYVDFVRSTRLVVALKALSKIKTAQQGGTADGATDEDLAKATSVVESARSAVSQAFEFSLGKVGLLPGSDGLWEEWLSFVRSMPSGTEYEVEQRREQLRKALQRAIAVPTARVANGELWTEYEAFERDNAQDVLASRLLDKHRPAFVTASAVAQERSALWAKINPHLVPVQPPQPGAVAASAPSSSSAGEAAATKASAPADTAAARGFAQVCEQVPLWRALLRYEARNPLRLGPEAHASLMRAHLQRCLLSTRCLPHFWAELALLELRSGGLLQPGEPLAALAERPDAVASPAGAKAAQAALKTLTEGCHAARTSQALAITAADTAELLGNTKAAGQLYDQAAKQCPEAPIWTAWMRFARRTDSAVAARRVFVAAKAQSTNPAVFLTAAEIEASANGDAAIALNIIDLGRKRLQDAVAAGSETPQALVNYFVAGCRLAMNHADDANTRSLFESCLEGLRPEQRGPVLALYLSYEARLAAGGGDMKRLARLEMRCWREVGSLPGVPDQGAGVGEDGAATMTAQAHHWQAFGLAPAAGAADAAMFAASAFQPAMFHDSMGGLLLGATATTAGAAAAARATGTGSSAVVAAASIPQALLHSTVSLAGIAPAKRPGALPQLDGQVAAPIPQTSVPVHPSLLKAKQETAAPASASQTPQQPAIAAAVAAVSAAPESISVQAAAVPSHPSVRVDAPAAASRVAGQSAPDAGDGLPGFLKGLWRPGMRLGPRLAHLALQLGPSPVADWMASPAEAQFVMRKACQAPIPPHVAHTAAAHALSVSEGNSGDDLPGANAKRQRETGSSSGSAESHSQRSKVATIAV